MDVLGMDGPRTNRPGNETPTIIIYES